MRKRTLTKKEQALKDEFEKMMAKHSKPLERGAKAKGQVVKTAPVSKRELPVLEAGRVNREPSLDTGYNSTAPKQTMMYTGDKVMGVALMHKSTFAPIMSQQEAIDVAKMRR